MQILNHGRANEARRCYNHASESYVFSLWRQHHSGLFSPWGELFSQTLGVVVLRRQRPGRIIHKPVWLIADGRRASSSLMVASAEDALQKNKAADWITTPALNEYMRLAPWFYGARCFKLFKRVGVNTSLMSELLGALNGLFTFP